MEKLSKAPDHIVRAILIALCEDGRQEKKALAYLNKLTAKAAVASAFRAGGGSGGGGAGSSNTGTSNALGNGHNASLKRKAESNIQICARCKDPFYPEENVGKPCRYHPGTPKKPQPRVLMGGGRLLTLLMAGWMEVDDEGDFWADHDERCHGTIDTAAMREQCPEGFFWDCCDKDGKAEGCTRGRHHAADDTRARLESDSLESEEDNEDDKDDDDSDESDEGY